MSKKVKVQKNINSIFEEDKKESSIRGFLGYKYGYHPILNNKRFKSYIHNNIEVLLK